MTLNVIGSAELGIHAEGGGAYTAITSNDVIVSSPALSGTYSYAIDPVGGDGSDRYGWLTEVLANTNYVLVSFIFQNGADFDANVAIAELSIDSTRVLRQIVLTNAEALAIFDEQDDEVGTTSNGYITAGTTYYILWLYDQRDTSNTRDILWVYQTSWDKPIDVARHGDGAADLIVRLAFGSRVGKGALPTVGGRLFVDDMCLQDLENAPNNHPLASITAKIKMPSANGTDTDFDSGAPDFNDIDEIPGNDDTDYDAGDAVNEKSSYAINDADSGDGILAVQVVGLARMTANTSTTCRGYVYDGSTRDVMSSYTPGFTVYTRIETGAGDTYNQVNGVNLTETLYNTLEAGLEVTLLGAATEVRLTQLGLEYAYPGPRELPQDFPILNAGVALGSGNMGII